MRKVYLRMNEQLKYDIIKKLVVSNGNKKNAAIKLNCSLRTVNRLIIKYNLEGKKGFVHKNRNRKPVTTFSDEVKLHVLIYINLSIPVLIYLTFLNYLLNMKIFV